MTSNTHDSEFTDKTDDTAGRTADGVEDASQGDKTVLRKIADNAASAARGAYTNAAGATGVAARRVRADGRKVWEVTASSAGQVMASAQALLPDSIASDLNRMLGGMVQGSATIYDKAMDANYLDPLLKADLSGSYHRLFDGGHTIGGAFSAARDALPDDTIIQETLGTLKGLLNDVTTIRGLPLANWNKETSADLKLSAIDPCDPASHPNHRVSDTIPASIVPSEVSARESTAFSKTRLHPLNNSDGVLFCVRSAIARRASRSNGYSSGSSSSDL